jgi:8-oxo-dGTP pyrophosphatase MutT (NUDIX family)
MRDALLRQLTNPAAPKLRPSDAVAALLVHQDGRYIMQLRDSKEGIFYPDHWGCFGGAVEPAEDPGEALKRELREELEFAPAGLRRFTQFDFDFAPLGHPKVYRLYFEVEVDQPAFQRFVLHEGAEVRAFEGQQLLSDHKVTPYDAFAIWMHMYRRRA